MGDAVDQGGHGKSGEEGTYRYATSCSSISLTHYARQALEHIIYYVVLAPHENEQSDMMHRMYKDPATEGLDLQQYVVLLDAQNFC